MTSQGKVALGCLGTAGLLLLGVVGAASESLIYPWLIALTVLVAIIWSTARLAAKRVDKLESELQLERQLRTYAVGALVSRVDELELLLKSPAPSAAEAPEAKVAMPELAEEPAAASVPPLELAAEIPIAATAAETAPTPVAAAPPPAQIPAQPRAAWRDSLRSLTDMEQMLGVNWLSKLGVAVLVLGVGFFLAWQLREVGPGGKVTVGLVVATALLGAGIWWERSERYRILARASLAGGWSLLFFVSYAAHHVAATRVLESAAADLVLMLIVVAAMVVHTLRFRSQVVTGLAFTLAFTTVALNRVDVYSLTANVVLAIGFAYVIVRMQWFKLELVGMIAAYVNHAIWLQPIIGPMHGQVRPFPEFFASATILLLYWAVFRTSYVLRPPVDERTSAVAGVLNSALLLGVMKYQSAHPELAFAALLTLGAVELVLGRVAIARRKPTTFIVLTTLGATLMVAAIPFRYAAAWVSPIWLIEAELLFFVGVLTGERVYRRLGMLGTLATATQLLAIPVARLLGWRLGGALPLTHEWTLGTICAAVMIAMYADARWVPRLRPDAAGDDTDARIARIVSYVAVVIGAAAGWAMFPASGTAVAWIALAVVLAAAGHRFGLPDLTIEGSVLAAAAVIRVLAVNLPSNDIAIATPVAISWRLITVSAVVVMVYLLSRWNRSALIAVSRAWPQSATWAGSALLALLAWYELLPISVAGAWTIVAIALYEIGVARVSVNLRIQAYAAFAAALVRTFVVNMNAETSGWLGARVTTIVPIAAAFLFMYFRREGLSSGDARDSRPWIAKAFAWMSLACVVSLVRFEMSSDLVAVAWAALVLTLVAVASLSGRRTFLHIGIAIAVGAAFRAVMHNLYERSYFPPPGRFDTWLFVGAIIALLFGSLPFAFRMRRIETPQPKGAWKRLFRWFDARPEQVLFFLPLLLLTILLATQMRKGMLTVAWGIEAVVVFVAAVRVGERSYRFSGLALLLLAVGKIFAVDFWTLALRDKALTGIVVGMALIGVSILYTKKRDAILQFL